MPDTPHDRMAFSMPEFSMLSDADIAEVVNYVRNSWTNQASEVTVDDVVKMRHFLRIKPRVGTDLPPEFITPPSQGGRKDIHVRYPWHPWPETLPVPCYNKTQTTANWRLAVLQKPAPRPSRNTATCGANFKI